MSEPATGMVLPLTLNGTLPPAAVVPVEAQPANPAAAIAADPWKKRLLFIFMLLSPCSVRGRPVDSHPSGKTVVEA
jgi:hypothetical protein